MGGPTVHGTGHPNAVATSQSFNKNIVIYLCFYVCTSCFGRDLNQSGNELPRQLKCYLVWRVVNRTRPSHLKLPLLLTINSPRERKEEREETRDEAKMKAILIPSVILLLLTKIG